MSTTDTTPTYTMVGTTDDVLAIDLETSPTLSADIVVPTTSKLPIDLFSRRKKLWILFQAAMAGLLTALSSSIYLPALLDVEQSLQTTTIMVNLTVSLYNLFVGLAPLMWAPLSERFGRRPIYISSLIVYVVTSIVCALSRSIELFAVMRAIQAMGVSAVSAVAAGTVSDIFHIHERGTMLGYALIGPLIGPVIGPMIGGAMNQYLGWYSIFWFLTGVGTLVLVLNVLTMPETLVPEKRQRDGCFNPLKPLVLLRYPVVLLIALYPALMFGFLYLQITVLPATYIRQYGFNTTQVGLTFLAGGFGNIIGTVLSGRYADWNYRRAQARKQGRPVPEVRLLSIWPSVILAPIGFILYGWFVQAEFHWFVPLIGSFLFGIGMMMSNTVAGVYLIDAFTSQAASAMSISNALRSILAAITPLFAAQMVDALDDGWTFTVLALIMLVSSLLVVLVYVFGHRMRPVSA